MMEFDKGSRDLENKKNKRKVPARRKGKKSATVVLKEEGLIEVPIVCKRGEKGEYGLVDEEVGDEYYKGGGGWPLTAIE